MVDISNASLAEWFSEIEQHRCGYCKNPSGSVSFGMMVESMTVEDYQDLIDRGWRRSGKYCYKPSMDKTCCPQYTIRCDAVNFVLNKSHKKVIKKFNKFLRDGVLQKKNVLFDNMHDDSCSEYQEHKRQSVNIDLKKVITTSGEDLKNVVLEGENPEDTSSEKIEGIVASIPERNQKHVREGVGPDHSKPPCKKAKFLRLERKKAKLQQKGEAIQFVNGTNEQKSLNQFLEDIPTDGKLKLKMIIVKLDRGHCTFEVSARLYAKYQTSIHREPLDSSTQAEFFDFLVRSPLKFRKFPDGVDGPGYGSFHQQYWLDDRLIAVAVIDVLPKCVSSVYFFYDPDYRDLTLGTYGSLREVQFVQSLHSKIADLRYYYMGFYIHSCPKMRYKGNLRPSYLLCPESYVFVPIERCLPKLDASKYSRLNDDAHARDENACTDTDLDKIKVVYNLRLMYVSDFVRVFGGDRETFKNLGKLVGRRSAHNILFWIG
ncbi:arginyl-tRNA--protein transferase 1 isoform X2 [Cylas formicarius]|uniref:arginyl-tRNA--protein transferase 1 isoform X2 n=1 Tax=Cylas formicarius TaxID=197179 RepID=UPI002958BCE3|nr:arginyl-tRNA--protein transferase 1 isoform X2 [Cylas formicarius]